MATDVFWHYCVLCALPLFCQKYYDVRWCDEVISVNLQGRKDGSKFIFLKQPQKTYIFWTKEEFAQFCNLAEAPILELSWVILESPSSH